MKVTISPDGDVVFDTDDVGQALDMIKALRNGHAKPKAEPVEESVPLTAKQYDAWSWLVANDRPTGVKVEEIAAGLGIAVPATGARLKGLLRHGVVRRVRRGFYRPGEASE